MTAKLSFVFALCLAVAACSGEGSNRRIPVKKSPFNKSAAGGSNKSKQIGEAGKGESCFDLKAATEKLKSFHNDSYTVYTRDATLASVSESETSVIGPQLKARVLLTGNLRPFMQSVTGDLLQQSAVGHLLNVTEQTDCQSVTFADSSVFQIVDNGTKLRGYLKLQSTDKSETRFYYFGGDDQVRIVVSKPLSDNDLAGCLGAKGLKSVATLVVAWEGARNQLRLARPLVEMLGSSLKNPPSGFAVPQTGKNERVASQIDVKYSEFDLVLYLLEKGHLKDLDCSK